MKKFLAAIRRAYDWAVPTFLVGREKAVAAFLTPIIVAQLARFVPSVHVSSSLVEQVIGAVIISLTVHTVTNTPVG